MKAVCVVCQCDFLLMLAAKYCHTRFYCDAMLLCAPQRGVDVHSHMYSHGVLSLQVYCCKRRLSPVMLHSMCVFVCV